MTRIINQTFWEELIEFALPKTRNIFILDGQRGGWLMEEWQTIYLSHICKVGTVVLNIIISKNGIMLYKIKSNHLLAQQKV